MTVLLRILPCYPVHVFIEPPVADVDPACVDHAADHSAATLAPVPRLEAARSRRLSRPRATLDLPFQVDILAGQLAPSSLAMYARDVRAYLRFAGSADAALAPETLARFRAELAERGRHSPNTINRMLSAVKRLVHEAAAQAYVEHETAAAFGRVSGVRVRALRERLRPHSRVRIEPLDMRRVCELPGPLDIDRPARRGAAGDIGLERPARGRAGRTPCRGCGLPTGRLAVAGARQGRRGGARGAAGAGGQSAD